MKSTQAPRPIRAGLAVALLVVLAVLPASAQEPDEGVSVDAPAATPEEPEAPLEVAPEDVESITVIGERLDATDIQDEAQAITAFSAEDLDRANIVNIDSLAFNVPGLHVGQSGQQAIVTLRGVGTENASITGEPGVAFHVDGVNFSQPSAARVAFFDLETLDVKRGPQGLRGGKNSTSGSINVVTRKPSDEYEMTGDVLFGNYDRVRLRGAVNIPLGELFAVRTALFHEDRDGFLDNELVNDSRDFFDADDFGLRSHALFTPTDSLQVLLSYNYFKQTGNGPQADLVPTLRNEVPCRDNTTGQTFNAGPTVMPVVAACRFDVVREQEIVIDPVTGFPRFVPAQIEFSPAIEDPSSRATYTDFLSAQDNRFWGWTGTIDWDAPALPLLGETRLKAIGGFQRSELTFRQDFDATNIPQTLIFNQRNADQHTAELQWSGVFAERVEWLAGGYFARETGERLLRVPPSLDTRLAQPTIITNQETENTAYGAYLHTTWSITDNVRFELGGRWIKDEKKTKLAREAFGGDQGSAPDLRFIGCEGSLGALADVNLGVLVPQNPPPWCSLTFRDTAWGASLDWRPFGGDQLFYGKIDRGYKSGGFRSGRRGEYLPEKIWAYALGTKSEFLDSRLQVNLEGFFYAYEDMQLVVIDGTSLRTENADTRMYGWDLEAKATPVPGLQLGAIVSFLKTETLDYTSLDPGDVVSFEGDAGGASLSQISEFQKRRLNERDRVEDLTDDGFPRTFEEDGRCWPTPSDVGRVSPNVPCGTVTDFGGFDDFTGNDLSRAPKWKITLSAEYEIPLGDYGFLTPRVQYTWQDDTYYRVFNRSFDLQDDYHMTDVKLIWRSPEDVFEVEAFVTNIEDEAPKQNILIGPRGFGAPPLAWYGPPRFYGVRVGFRY
jgi:iron complex outermembrane receptor protein